MIRRLFDTSFQTWVTPDILRTLFVLGVVSYAAMLLSVDVAWGFQFLEWFVDLPPYKRSFEHAWEYRRGTLSFIALSPVAFLLGVAVMRIATELTLVVFRLQEDIRGIRTGASWPPGDRRSGPRSRSPVRG